MFGGNIPGKVQSVEFLEVQSGPDAGGPTGTAGMAVSPLRKLVSIEEKSLTGRAAYILGQRAAVMP